MLKQDKFWEKLSKETKPVGHMAPQKNESEIRLLDCPATDEISL